MPSEGSKVALQLAGVRAASRVLSPPLRKPAWMDLRGGSKHDSPPPPLSRIQPAAVAEGGATPEHRAGLLPWRTKTRSSHVSAGLEES